MGKYINILKKYIIILNLIKNTKNYLKKLIKEYKYEAEKKTGQHDK